MRYLVCFLFALPPLAVVSAQEQPLSGVSARWNDSFVEWDVYTTNPDTSDPEAPGEIVAGELKLRWLNVNEDWTQWDFTLGELRGTVRLKWQDPNEWELRTYAGDVITMRTAWRNDFKEWRITNNSVALTLRSRWTNQLDEWLVDDPNRGRFYLYTLRERDPRDWAIEDSLDESVSTAMKLAMVFLTVFHSSPRM